MKIIIIAGFTQSLVNFRGHLIKRLKTLGYQVIACAPQNDDRSEKWLKDNQIEFIKINIDTTGINPIKDIKSIFTLYKLFKKIKPDYIFSYTIKPVIYGSYAARQAGIKNIYSMITGLGYTFDRGSFKQNLTGYISKFLYKTALNKNKLVFFQNSDDLEVFHNLKIISQNTQTKIINGSGVDLNYFEYSEHFPKQFAFLLIGRLLKDKGIREYAEAARKIKEKYPEIEFNLIGYFYKNPNCISESVLNTWVREGLVNYLGETADVRPYLKDCSVYVLPSYREGTPRTVLEAMAVGRPIITTDVPGCRETVIPEENGFLVKKQNVDSLVEAMLRLYFNPDLVVSMGKRSREIAEEKYDVHRVNETILVTMEII